MKTIRRYTLTYTQGHELTEDQYIHTTCRMGIIQHRDMADLFFLFANE
jgi:hypothetical protein